MLYLFARKDGVVNFPVSISKYLSKSNVERIKKEINKIEEKPFRELLLTKKALDYIKEEDPQFHDLLN